MGLNETNHIPNESNCVNVACSLSVEVPKIKEAVKKVIANEYSDYYDTKVNELMMQGDFLKMLNQEEEDITWRSLIFSVPRGVLSFGIRAATNSLATNDNLQRWGKKTTSKCHLCPQIGSLLHVISGCKVALDQGRFTYRHNSVLSYLVNREDL